ncbi:MAG: ribosome small subunit-dependent GTPase A [Eubacteriaceae bacterium]
MEGIIVKGIGGFYYVKTKDGVYECKARGIFRKENIKPYIGDYVNIDIDENNIGTINNINTRKNFLIRPPISNITQGIIISSVVDPKINFDFINKILVMAEKTNIKIVLCFNKIDLISVNKQKQIKDFFINTNYKFLYTSVKKNIGINELREVLKNNVSVFAGSSGVGKSSLLNSIIPDLNLKTGIISDKNKRGKHTTRHVELFELDNNSFIADTPGFSNLDIIQDIEIEELMHYFPEFDQHLSDCKYNTCLHNCEPDCGVKHALNNGHISRKRYNSYLELLNQIKSNINKY